ncbi:P-loop containing nucleoside triphosphate hydrolase protein [Neocallimastix lanati (nom. inval.)]|nr:P-loop containing nucleoside triphosphate hydrolase protein [Neocallimastix sp. JGI-2020a]
MEDEPPKPTKLKSKKEKERERKERQKQAKKEKAKKEKAASQNNSGASTPEPSTPTTPATPAKGKRKGPPVAALKAMIEKQKAMEEERKRLEEEERKRIEEEERLIAEEERKKEEARQQKKEKERLKKERLKKEGKYLTKSQKEAQQRNKLKLQQMLEQGVTIAAFEKKDGEKKKKVVYGKRKKNNKKSQTNSQAESTEVSSKEESVKEVEETKEDVKDSWEDFLDDDAEVIPAPAPKKEVKDSWEDEDEEEEDEEKEEKDEKKEKENEDIKDSWEDEEEEKEIKEEKKSKETKPKTSKKQEQNDEEEDDEEDEEDEEERKKRKEESAQRRKKRMEDALQARNENDLRSPICVVLGHVDTGKTKLLDKIRQTNVQDGEAGGITQQIGATYFPMESIKIKTAKLNNDGFEYKVPGLLVIDTPGHESFTNLRSRGSSLCNIAVLVVDIMHGLEPQTLESIGLLRQRKTPFVVALNKIDRIYGWKAIPDAPIQETLAQQPKHVIQEFEERVQQTIVAFNEQGLNATLSYENKNFSKYVSLCPTSAHTGEGIPDLLRLLVKLTQERMTNDLMYLSELECTVLEVKVIEGLGTTIDVILSNGKLHEGDRIVLCGLNGPIATNIRALLTPQPMRELRVKSAYIHHKEVKAALGVKICAPDLEKAIAGSRLLVVQPGDDEEDLLDEVMSDLQNLQSAIDKSGKGVCVQASTLGSLEALLEFLRESKIPVSGINIGPVHKKDIIRASIMLESQPEYAQILAFDVKVDKEAQDLADEMGVKIFKADIIYHLFDQFTKYMEEVTETRRRDQAPSAVFPCKLKIVPGCVFNKRNPIVIGVDVLEGQLRIGTPLCVVNAENQIVSIGKVIGIELNHKAKEVVRKGDPAVAIKIESPVYETPKMVGRHFFEKDLLYSRITRASIDILKSTFRNDVTKEEWALIIQLKKILSID